jgi:hypothetical protein
MTTTTELMESDIVCQASAVRAMDPETIPAQYFRANKLVLMTMDMVPSR